ncbi:MAG: UDP-N-acetylglucosamine--N-acetylmuramyl-(pentapeptide) pyrophosphoryl-undecaprenol [Chloroflexota bacterium]
MEEDLVKRAGIPYRSVPAAGVHGVGLRALPGNLAKLTRGVLESRRILKEFKPDVLFFTGGYVAGPMAVAGRNLPIVLYVPDIEPGLALKFLGYFADVITVTAPDSKKFFSNPERIVHSGYPLRSGLLNWSREKAISHFGLDSSLPTLLVTGGSKGARSINLAVLNCLRWRRSFISLVHWILRQYNKPQKNYLPIKNPAIMSCLICMTWVPPSPPQTWFSPALAHLR